MAVVNSSETVRNLIGILRDHNLSLHPQTRDAVADALEGLLEEQEDWAGGGASELLKELRAVGWSPESGRALRRTDR